MNLKIKNCPLHGPYCKRQPLTVLIRSHAGMKVGKDMKMSNDKPLPSK